MKLIRDGMKITNTFDQKALSFIANQIRSMKRIWMGGSIEKGMSRRRDAEANLIENSLNV
jgi:GH24 family phage-related lysozyme (muramidase)